MAPLLQGVKTQTGRLNAGRGEDTGSCAGCGSYSSGIRSQSFSVSMTDLIAIPFTHGQAIYRIFTLGLFIYEQVPENRLLTPGGIAV